MSGEEEIVLCQCHDISRSFMSSCMSRFANTFVKRGSGSLPRLYLLGRRSIRGRLKSSGASGGVDVCFMKGRGDGERGDPKGDP